MNIEDLPKPLKDDIEDQSLEILERISGDIVVIGGWGVRAHLGVGHRRYTLDVDGVTDNKTLGLLRDRLVGIGLDANHTEWGIQFVKRYIPCVDIPDAVKANVEMIQLRIEISGPRISEYSTPHYFEFSLTETEIKEIPYHNRDGIVKVKVPPIEHMTAVKLGLPVDYKNNFDAVMLLQKSDVDKVVLAIKNNDDWGEMILRRMPKLKGRIAQSGRLENTLAIAAGIDVRRHISILEQIEKQL